MLSIPIAPPQPLKHGKAKLVLQRHFLCHSQVIKSDSVSDGRTELPTQCTAKTFNHFVGFKLQLNSVLFFKGTHKTSWQPDILEKQFSTTHPGTDSHLQCWPLFHQQVARSCSSFRPGNAEMLQINPTVPTPALRFPLSVLSAELQATPHKKC